MDFFSSGKKAASILMAQRVSRTVDIARAARTAILINIKLGQRRSRNVRNARIVLAVGIGDTDTQYLTS